MGNEGRRAILLVEDNAILGLSEKRSLEQYGYAVLVASSGERAIELFSGEASIELVLMDLDLGRGMDGSATARALLALRPVPIVFLSSHTEPEIVRRTEEITTYGYVVKNSGITVLDASIKMAFRLFEANEKLNRELAERRLAEAKRDQQYRYARALNEVAELIIAGEERAAILEGANRVIGRTLGMNRALIHRVSFAEDRIEALCQWVSPDYAGPRPEGMGPGNFESLRPALEEMRRTRRHLESRPGERDPLSPATESLNLLGGGAPGGGAVFFPFAFEACGYHLMALDSLGGRRTWLEEEFDFLASVAKQLSLALIKIRLLEERKETESRLKSFATHMVLAQRLSKTGSFDYNLSGDAIVFSEEMFRIFGLAPRETPLCCAEMLSRVHPEDREAFRTRLEGIRLEGGGTFTHRVLWSDGSVHEILGNAETQYDAAGLPTRMLGTSHELTYVRKVERELSEKHNLLENIINSSADFIFVKDRQLRTILCNRSFAGALGRRPEDLVGKTDIENGWSLESVRGDPVKGRMGQELGDLEALAGLTVHAESEESLGSGGTRVLDTIKLPLRDGQGEIIGMMGISRDITEHRRAETALRVSEARYRSLFNCMTEGFALHELLIDGDGQPLDYRFLDVNPAFEQLTGLRRGDLVGRTQKEVLPGEDAYWLETYARVALGGESLQLEHFSPILKRHFGVFAWRPAPMQFAVIFSDISGRKEIETSLIESEAKLHRIVSKSSELICELDDEGRFTFLSSSYGTVLGHEPERLAGSSMFDLMHPDDRGPAMERYRGMAGRAENAVCEWRLRDGEGGYRSFECRGSSYLAADGSTRSVIVSHDNSERRRDEEAIRRLLAEKEMILKEVHHRIKNFMGAILGIIRLQGASLAEPSAVAALADAGQRVQGMMLLYGKLYESATLTEMSLRDYLSDLVDEVLRNFPASASVTVEKDIDDIVLDPARLQSIGIIVNELLTNVMKHAFVGKARGRIGVSAKLEGRRVSLTVRDDGCGLSEAARTGDSAGFGLTLVRELVEQMEGRLLIDGGEGTRFALDFER
jgi:PAS domain S-box-containing protein